MATVSRTPGDPLAVPSWAAEGDGESKSERYLAKRLAAAGAEYKGVALTTFLLAAGVGGMLWLACGVVAEHWLVPGGLPAWLRWAWLAAGAVLLAAAVIRWVLPLIRYRVNLVYAARMLEQEHPDLHNDVVNAVLAQAHADETTPLVVKSLRRRAARQLSGRSGDGLVDRGPALKLAYALAALIAAACVYELLAPKSLLVSASRLMAPWLGVAAPSRVRIAPPTLAWSVPGGPETVDHERAVAVVDGVATLIRGRQLVVASDISGLAGEEQPALLVTPVGEEGLAAASGGWRLPLMPAAAGGFRGVLPDASRGLDQSVDIQIAAGDARSERIRVAVVDEPAMLVRELQYRYPVHTGQPAETIPWQGDIRGVEGTEVTVVAECNHPLEAAWIDLGADGKRDAPLTIDPKDLARGRGKFTLRLSPDRSAAEHARYRLLFQPKAASLAQREPTVVDKMEYRIEVLPDLAPEIAIEEPVEKVVRVPPDAPVTVRLRAVDPDFGLASVTVETRLAAGAERPGEELLVGARKNFRGAATLIPSALGAGPGQVLEYRGVAKDTRPDAANVATTDWYKLTIDASAPPREPPPAEAKPPKPADGSDGEDGKDGKDGQEGQNGGEPQASDAGGTSDAGGKNADPQAGKQGGAKGADGAQDGEQSPSQRQPDPKQGDKPGEPQEGEQQGSAEGGKPNESREGKAGKQPGQQQQPGSQDGAGSEPQGQGGAQQQGGQAGNRPDAGGGAAEQRPSGSGGQGEGKPGKSKSGGDRSQSDAPAGQGSGGAPKPDGQGRDGDRPAEAGKGQGKPREKETVASDGTDDGEAMERILEHRQQNQQGEGKQGEGKQGEGKQGEGKQGEGKQGEGKQGEGKQGEGKQGEGKQGEGKQGEGKQGEGQQGQGQQGEGKQGEGKQGEGKQGEGKQGEGQQGEGKQGEGKQGEGKQGEGKQGEGKQGEGKQGEGKQGEGKQGEGKQGEGKQGEGKQGEGKQGEGKQGEGKQGEGKQGEGKQGEGKQGEGKQGEGKQGEGKQGEGQQGEGQGEGQQGEGQQGEGQQGEGQQGEGQQGEGKQGEGKQGEGKQGEGKQGEGGDRDVQQQGGDASGSTVGGGAIGGDRGAAGGDEPAARQDREMEWGEQDLAHARNAADLAIEHLKKAVDSGDAGVLDELGWNADQARAFLARWEAMRRLARSGDPRARGDFDQAVKSLGLRPTGVRSSRDVPADVKGGQAEGRRSRPPSDYREQFKAFMQGAAPE
jgi:hypothetical protein